MLYFVSADPSTGTLEVVLSDFAAEINARLDQLLPNATVIPMELHEAMRYSCLAPGKRLRPVLVMAAAESVGGSRQKALDGGCAVEMIHAFSLIHDDLPAIDNDTLRRGNPTCHVKFGEGVAILAGDALFALAFEVISSCTEDPSRCVEVMKILTKAVGSDGLVGGETVDIQSEGKEIDKETLDFIHSRKTGALIKASCQIGGILGGGSADQVQSLAEYGQKIGLAFQIADDILNETSTAEQLGKAAGSDRERKKATYPAMYGLDESRRVALQLANEAMESVADFPNSELLKQIAAFSVNRMR